MRRIWKKHIGLLLVGSVVCILQMITIMKAQLLKGKILNKAISENQNSLLELIILLLIMTVISMVFSYIYALFRVRFSQVATKSLRQAFFKSLLERPYSQYKELSEGQVIAKYTKHISQLETKYFSLFAHLAEMVMKIAFVLITLVQLNLVLAIISFIVLSIPIIIPRLFEKHVSKAEKKKLKETESHISDLNSWLQSFETIKNYGIEKIIKGHYENSNCKLLEQEEAAENIKSAGVGVSFGASMGAQVAVAAISAYLVLKGSLNAGDFLSVLSLISIISAPLFWVAKLYQEIIATRPTRETLSSFIWENIKNEREGSVVPTIGAPEIKYRNVDFEYKRGEQLIKALNVSFNAGGHYLVTGPSGCGKSTAMNLLLGYYEPSSGEILINGIELNRIKQLNRLITIARQEAQLFQDTIRNNLTMYDSSISDEATISILKKVGLERFASKEGMEQLVLEEGGNLSGGEKKRLSLARALLRNAPIMILDEPLANVDPDNVGRIEDALLLIKNSTVIIISHQFSEDKLKGFDAVIKIQGGRIDETVMA